MDKEEQEIFCSYCCIFEGGISFVSSFTDKIVKENFDLKLI